MEGAAYRIREIFEHAIGLHAAERAAYLEAACNGDDSLHAEVMALLRGDELANSLAAFRHPDPACDMSSARDRGEARFLGPYRLLEIIGEGSAGRVYRASRGGDSREVAVKLLHGGPLARDAVRRLERERRLLESLDHPNIAGLIDGGEAPDGQPYLVTEFAPGGRIDDYCLAGDLGIAERVLTCPRG